MAIVCLKQDGQDEQDYQDGAAQQHGAKVCKTFMSIVCLLAHFPNNRK